MMAIVLFLPWPGVKNRAENCMERDTILLEASPSTQGLRSVRKFPEIGTPIAALMAFLF
jgi:hypothetical protein